MSFPTMFRRAGGAVLDGRLLQALSSWPQRFRQRLDLLLLTSAVLLILLAAVPTDVSSQQRLGLALVISMLVLGRLPRASTIPVTRILFLSAGAFLTLRYFFWRTAHTVVFHDVVSFTVSIMLYVAELYGIVLYLVSLVINARTLDRSEAELEAHGPESSWPTVDIMVPSYNEDPKLLEVTLLAALDMDYPEQRFEVYLLDDGGTEQKRSQDRTDDGSAPTEDAIVRADEARRRHVELQQLCLDLGCQYRTRARNEHAKAGNINAALESTSGELLLILDADHVPTPDFLVRTVGAFQRDPKLFLLQTPHFFINPDPVEKNLDTFRTMPSENEMFYAAIQKGLDFWNSSFFCGSAALLRRKHLGEQGISGASITEDAETALEIHGNGRGYRSAYFDQPLIAGLQPETFGGFVVQRTRWAQGMAQIFLLGNPFNERFELSPAQRLGYFNSSFFWFFAYSRFIFMIAPACFLIFGMQIYRANLGQFLGYAVPHLIGAVVVSHFLFGRVRWTLFSELYETLQSVFCLRGLIQVALNPRSPSFGVTPKGEHLERDFVSPFSPVFYALFGLTMVSLAFGVFRYQTFAFERGVVVITMAWATFNLLLLIAAIGSLYERRQRREMPRVDLERLPGRVRVGDRTVDCHMIDGSSNGVAFEVGWTDAWLLDAVGPFQLEVDDPRPERRVTRDRSARHGSRLTLEIMPRNFRYRSQRGQRSPGPTIVCGAEFVGDERRAAVALIYGDSRRWRRFLDHRRRSLGVLHGAFFLIVRGTRSFALHWLHLVGRAPWAATRSHLRHWRNTLRQLPVLGAALERGRS